MEKAGGRVWAVWAMLALSAVAYGAGFVHLLADFPNGSRWNDWSKMTDEGWYGGGAVHHFVQGHWYLADSFNPAVAMPVWPVMLGVWFRVVGVGMLQARVLTMVLYGVSLVLLYAVVRRAGGGAAKLDVTAALAVLMTALNPFCYAFDRLAVLEPVTVFWMMVALWMAGRTRRDETLWLVGLGAVLWLLLATKLTGVAVVPGVLWLLWATWRRDGRGGWLRPMALVLGTTAALMVAWCMVLVRMGFVADYRLLFSINADRAHLSILPKMALLALVHGQWVGVPFYLALIVGLLAVGWPRLWREPLFGAAVLVIVGHLAYIGYHTNFQPRYYLVVAMPMAVVVVVGVSRLEKGRTLTLSVLAVAAVVLSWETWRFVAAPEYSFRDAAASIATMVRADGGPNAVLLSDSGDDVTLFTGLPAVCEGYSVHGHEAMLARYQPGWYAAWPGWEDHEIARLGERYRLVEVARFKVFDDPKRQTLVLYRLTMR